MMIPNTFSATISPLRQLLPVLVLGLLQFARAIEPGVPVEQRLDSGWQYTRGDLGGIWEAVRSENSSELPTWQSVTLPHCFNATDAVNPYTAYYQGPGWYRRDLTLDSPFPTGRIELRFDGAGQKTAVFINQTQVGSHVGGYDEFTIDITDAVRQALGGEVKGVVRLSVRCDNSRDLEMIPSDLSDFNLYGGLYRPVHLLYRPAVTLDWPKIAVNTVLEDGIGEVSVEAVISNPERLEGDITGTWKLFAPDGSRVATEEYGVQVGSEHTKPLRFSHTVSRPQLWSPAAPGLYRWELTCTWNATGETHVQSGKLGFRHFEFKEKGPFFLNGSRLLLRGTHRHEDHAGVAAAQSDASLRTEMEMMKAMGVNFIRLGHYQQYWKVLELCDEFGFLVWEEIPWCRGGLGGDLYQEQARRMLTHMIHQHRHHPSIILWGLGNENDWPGDFPEFDELAIRTFMSELNDLAHALDPSRKTCIRRCDFCADLCTPPRSGRVGTAENTPTTRKFPTGRC